MRSQLVLAVVTVAVAIISTAAHADQCNTFVRQAMKAEGLAESQVERICATADTLASRTQTGATGTSASKEAKYFGVWQIIAEYNHSAFRIYKAGDTYIVETHFDNQGVKKFPGTFKDGQLKISTGLGESSIVYLDATDHLLAFSREYQRKGQ